MSGLLCKLLSSIQTKSKVQQQLDQNRETCCTCFDKSSSLISMCQYRHDHKMCISCAQQWIARHRVQYKENRIEIYMFPQVSCHMCRRKTSLDTIELINHNSAKMWAAHATCIIHNGECKTRKFNELHRLHCLSNTFDCEKCEQRHIPFHSAMKHFLDDCHPHPYNPG